MAISTTFKQIQEKFNPQYWASIDEFEEYYLKYIQEIQADRNYYTDRNGIEREIDCINNHPILKEYEIWEEGFSATGQSSGAILLGKCKARNFAQACDIIMCQDHLKWIEKVNNIDYEGYCPPTKWDYDPQTLKNWGCKLFWSEELARKVFN